MSWNVSLVHFLFLLSVEDSHSITEFYEDRFLLSELTDKIKEDTLCNFVEVVTGYEVTKAEYSTDLSFVVVTLDQQLDDEGEMFF